ncbi:hypothetical protein AX16_001458 [Volvariella volvacea WC 439]|nr:hypothetical protein AX16_001458 [Volvariella volvacea WC 439]
MATNLYEILGVPKSATTEEIRKAYRKKALQTHPDRLPVGATEADKKASEESFRKVNNAYEVLNDSKTRKLYDQHGVWPPPEVDHEEAHYAHAHAHSHSHAHRHHAPHADFVFTTSPFTTFTFTDPFVLFQSIFGDMPHIRHTSHRGFAHTSPFGMAFAELDDLMASVDQDPFSTGFMMHPMLPPPQPRFSSRVHISTSSGHRPRSGTRWQEERMVTNMVNGRVETIHQTRDWEGNEHVRRLYDDGREVYTINGVEQPSRGYLPSNRMADSQPMLDSRSHHSQASRHNAYHYNSPAEYRPSPSPSYHSQNSYDSYQDAGHSGNRRRERKHESLRSHAAPNPHEEYTRYDERAHRYEEPSRYEERHQHRRRWH